MVFDLDFESLGSEFSPEISGVDLEYDADFVSMEQAAVGKAEQQFGDTIIEAEPPEWKEVGRCANSVLQRSHDLRAAVHLANATLALDGLVSFSKVMTLIKSYVADYWETFHPVLDPEDDNDPTFRVNTLMSMCDYATTLSLIHDTPLISVKGLGGISLQQWRIAHGDVPPKHGEEGEKLELSVINAAFQDADWDHLKANSEAAEGLVSTVTTIEELVTDQVGSGDSCNFEVLMKDLKQLQRILAEQVDLRAVQEEPAEDPTAEGDFDEKASNNGGSSPGAVASGKLVTIENLNVTTRHDAVLALDKVCQYFEKYEPSSPLPLLLKRARRLSNKSFLEIIKDISPDGMHQVESLGGLEDDVGSSSGSESDYHDRQAEERNDDDY